MKTYFVDSFTTEIFKGNPAAVCIPDSELDNDTMQKIATEIGFSETAFIKQITENTYSIRFFTPKIEIPLCGHATLASSKIIFDCGTDDFFYTVNKALHEKMLRLKIQHDYIERPGKHDWNYWRNAVKYQLLFFKNYFDEN